MNLVLDSSALIAYLRAEQGGTLVDKLIADRNNVALAHAVNLCEVYYDVTRLSGEPRAQAAIKALHDAGIVGRDDLDVSFWQDIGRYKANLRRISLADCFCLALATRAGAKIVTADCEFEQVVNQDLCEVEFIR